MQKEIVTLPWTDLASDFNEIAAVAALELHQITDSETTRIKGVLKAAKLQNPWFTQKEIARAFKAWGEAFSMVGSSTFLRDVPETALRKEVAIISAGNIPLVGFHDVLCVLLSGCTAQVKLSSEDTYLIPLALEVLCKRVPAWKDRIQVVDQLKKAQIAGLIATGSDNTARYFEYYFRDVPKIIRKNRTSVAVLSGEESEADLDALGLDLFAYYGLGCRNVAKLFVPAHFDVQRIFKIMPAYEYLENHNKYMNNYTYHKALYLMNKDKLLDNGFVMLKESTELHSPISVIYFERYKDLTEVNEKFQLLQDKIQCRVGVEGLPFGTAQKPSLQDYADNVNTLRFLKEL